MKVKGILEVLVLPKCEFIEDIKDYRVRTNFEDRACPNLPYI